VRNVRDGSKNGPEKPRFSAVLPHFSGDSEIRAGEIGCSSTMKIIVAQTGLIVGIFNPLYFKEMQTGGIAFSLMPARSLK
jgi:hypothetical protein